MKSNREWNFHQFWNSDGDEKILNNSNVASQAFRHIVLESGIYEIDRNTVRYTIKMLFTINNYDDLEKKRILYVHEIS